MIGVRTPGDGTEETAVADCERRPERPGLRPGEVVGRYVVEDLLAAGGMGFVIAARDPELDRPVAIKVLFRRDDAGEVWLRREAQALAALNHPNIVVVHDVGMVEGRPFIAMERVDGVTLRTWLEEAPRSTSEILQVFIAAGRALAAAHEQGIVHCDFKPSNVMIRRGAAPLSDAVCLMDFGLARLHGAGDSDEPTSDAPIDAEAARSLLSQDFTEFDKLQGTPKYMAPEQFSMLGVTPATDQYAFCIALYEALWQRSPFQGDDASERMTEQMIGAAPRRPPARRGQKRLVNSVLRGLCGLPQERWPSLTDLCNAIDPSRRRTAWAAGMAALAVSVVGVVAVLSDHQDPCAQIQTRPQAVWNAPTRDSITQAFAQTGRAYASDAWSKSEADVDAWVASWVSVAEDHCRSTSPAQRDDDHPARCLNRQLHRLDAVTDALRAVDADDVLSALDTVAALPEPGSCLDESRSERPADPDLAARVDALYEELARCDVLGHTGRTRAFETCARDLVRSAEDTRYEPVVLDARRTLARAVFDTGRREESRQLYEALYFDANAAGRARLAADAALAVAFRSLRGDADTTRKWLRHAEPIRASTIGDARFLRVKALHAHHARDVETAIESARKAVALAEDTGRPRLLASSLNTLGKVLNENGHSDQAQPVYERALEVRRATHGNVHPLLATSLNNLATVYGDRGDFERALTMLEEALAIRRELLPHHHRHIATATANVAETHARMGHHDRALALHRESADVFATTEGKDSTLHAILQVRVATDLRALNRLDEARAALALALPILRRRPLGDHDRFGAELELALLDAAEGDSNAAVQFLEASLDAPLREQDLNIARTELAKLGRGDGGQR